MDFPEIPEQPEKPLSFFFEDVSFDLPGEEKLSAWLLSVAEAEGKPVREISYIFCSDERLRGINLEFLDHDYYTDIITFDYSDASRMQGEMYISSERVAENARTNGVSFFHELCRVMVHGVLHMAGYKDKNPEDEIVMREKEDFYLAKFHL